MSIRQLRVVARDPAAPRLIESASERCVPWASDLGLVREHVRRYLWAGGLVEGRRVLDLASGEGFGTAILATTASTVVGVDIDPRSVEHSRLGYRAPNLSFAVADALDLAGLPAGGFDAVVAFGVIDRLSDHARLLGELRRVLDPAGVLIVSGPQTSDFHHRIAARFANVVTLEEPALPNGAAASLRPSSNGADAAAIVVSLASDAPLSPAPSPELAAAVERELSRWLESHNGSDHQDGEAERQLEQTRELERARAVLSAQDAEVVRTRRQLARALMRTAAECAHVEALEHHVNQLASGHAAREAALRAELEQVSRRLHRIDESILWELFSRVRASVFRTLGGEDSRRVRALQATLRFCGRRLNVRSAFGRGSAPASAPARADAPLPIVFPVHPSPEVSIVIPVHAHAELTRGALESIRQFNDGIPYEVIVVDDSDDQPTKELLTCVDGATIIVNPENLGYAESVAAGVAQARGDWLVLCNNDIAVRSGWLHALLECADSAPDIGIVTPKYLYPDGTLAEAGGVIWRDGSGANYGRGDNPRRHCYQYRRDVDYGSAAALLVRTDLWRLLGGYDERFKPMYYEDADLCFAARAAGFRVVYEPQAEVVHIEGATAGTDDTAGHKRELPVNRPRFEQKWRSALVEHLECDWSDPGRIWRAASRTTGYHRALVVDHGVPTWDRDAGSLRMREMLKALVALGCHVTFFPENLAPLQPYTRELQRLGIEVLYEIDPHEVLAEIGPGLSLALLSRPHTAAHWVDRIRQHAPQATVAYDTVDLHWLREARRAATNAGGEYEILLSPRAVALRALENAMVRVSDTAIVVTEAEAERVRADVPEASVRVIPIGNQLRTVVPPASERAGVVFVGGFAHPPNVDAAIVLVRDVMPLVWDRLPDVRLTIVGSDPPAAVHHVATDDRVEITGWVEDLDAVLGAARVLVAPLRYGAGLKGKVTQALAEGLPVVTTPIGAEGLDAEHGEHMLIGIGAVELADHAVALLTDDDQWTRLSSAGQLLIADRGSPAVIATALRGLLETSCQPDLSQPRA